MVGSLAGTVAAVALDVRLPAGFAVGLMTGLGVGFALDSCPLPMLPDLFRVCLVPPHPAIFSGFIHSSYLQRNKNIMILCVRELSATYERKSKNKL